MLCNINTIIQIAYFKEMIKNSYSIKENYFVELLENSSKHKLLN